MSKKPGPSSSSSISSDSDAKSDELVVVSPPPSELCTTYVEELVDIDQLKRGDACPYCAILVGRHNRKPIPSVSHVSSASVIPSLSSKVSFNDISRLITSLPKWSKNTVCNT